MKKIYLIISLLATAFLKADAQNVDLAAFVEIGVPEDEDAGQTVCINKFFTPGDASADSIHGVWGFLFQGPDALLTTDKLNYRTSFHHFLTQAECDAQSPPVPFADRYAWYSISAIAQQQIDNDGMRYSYDSLGEIGMLLDWEKYQLWGIDSARAITQGPPHEQFVNGKAYGFFVRTYGIGENAESIQNQDDDMDNNWAVVKILWRNDCTDEQPNSIGSLIAPLDKVEITVFPNPAENEIGLNYTFNKNVNVTIYIRDIAGKIVNAKNFGHVTAGERNFKMDISKLAAGMYTLEMNAGDFRGISKFTVKK